MSRIQKDLIVIKKEKKTKDVPLVESALSFTKLQRSLKDRIIMRSKIMTNQLIYKRNTFESIAKLVRRINISRVKSIFPHRKFH